MLIFMGIKIAFQRMMIQPVESSRHFETVVLRETLQGIRPFVSNQQTILLLASMVDDKRQAKAVLNDRGSPTPRFGLLGQDRAVRLECQDFFATEKIYVFGTFEYFDSSDTGIFARSLSLAGYATQEFSRLLVKGQQAF